MKIDCKCFNRRVVWLAGILLLAGCQILEVKDPAGTNSPETEASESATANNHAASIDAPLVAANDSLLAMLRYSRYINTLDKQQLEIELKKVTDAYFLRANERTGLKLALILIKPDSGFSDVNQAKQILTDITNSDQSLPEFQEFSRFMLLRITERERDNRRYNDLEERMNNELAARKKLEEQLEALKTIEQSISERHDGAK
jgi:hypothetical protein